MSYVAKSEDDDVAKIFVDSLVKDVEDIYQRFLRKPKKMIFTAVEEEIFNSIVQLPGPATSVVESWG